MNWKEIEPGRYVASGRSCAYLVWFSQEDGQVRLTRWPLPDGGDWLNMAAVLEALQHVVCKQVPRGPGRPPLPTDAEGVMARLRAAADWYETGVAEGEASTYLSHPDWAWPPRSLVHTRVLRPAEPEPGQQVEYRSAFDDDWHPGVFTRWMPDVPGLARIVPDSMGVWVRQENLRVPGQEGG
jgi:hypothetical protein